jgi:hypothetical protein
MVTLVPGIVYHFVHSRVRNGNGGYLLSVSAIYKYGTDGKVRCYREDIQQQWENVLKFCFESFYVCFYIFIPSVGVVLNCWKFSYITGNLKIKTSYNHKL